MMKLNDVYRAVYFSFRHHRVRVGGFLFLGTFLCSLTITLFLWLPVYTQYSQEWEQNIKLQDEIFKVGQQNKLVLAYKLNKKRLSNVEKKIIVKNRQTEIINGISNLAKRNYISIISESYNEGAAVNDYALLNQNLVLEGSYFSIRQFLRDIDQLAVWTVPHEVRLKSLSGNENRIRASLKLTLYSKVGFN